MKIHIDCYGCCQRLMCSPRERTRNSICRRERQRESFFRSFCLDILTFENFSVKTNSICESSLYSICGCKNKFHLPMNLPLYDGHCHVDLFFSYGLNEANFNRQLSNGRRTIFIDNWHWFHRWFTNYELKIPNTKVCTTYGIHPKYVPSNLEQVFVQLQNIFKNPSIVTTEIVAIGECGLDETSTSSYELQLNVFKSQLKLAAELNLPLVLHGRGINSFDLMLNELKLNLNRNHKIHWHCINPRNDLNVISTFLHHFENSLVGLNCSIIPGNDLELENSFHKWFLGEENIFGRTTISKLTFLIWNHPSLKIISIIPLVELLLLLNTFPMSCARKKWTWPKSLINRMLIYDECITSIEDIGWTEHSHLISCCFLFAYYWIYIYLLIP